MARSYPSQPTSTPETNLTCCCWRGLLRLYRQRNHRLHRRSTNGFPTSSSPTPIPLRPSSPIPSPMPKLCLPASLSTVGRGSKMTPPRLAHRGFRSLLGGLSKAQHFRRMPSRCLRPKTLSRQPIVGPYRRPLAPMGRVCQSPV